MDWLTGLWEKLPEPVRLFLAALGGAAVTALIALFREAIAGFFRRLGTWIAGLMGQRWADRRFERRYRRWLAEDCQKVTLIGVLPTRPGREPRLAEVFVEPLLAERRSPGYRPEEAERRMRGMRPGLFPPEEEAFLPESRGELPFAPTPRTLSVAEALRLHPKLAVLGEPGAGKTTLLRYLALNAARGQSDRQDRNLLPVLLPLRTFAQGDALFEAMEEHVRWRTHGVLSPPQGYFQRQAEWGRCLFLLDGLDEVLGMGEEAYRRACGAVTTLAGLSPGNRFVVTSRIAGWRGAPAPGFVPLYVEPFDQERRREFARRWYRAVEGSAAPEGESPDAARIRERRAEERAGDFIRAVEGRGNDRLRRLAENPLLLSVMAMVHRTDITLPRERARLYDRCTELLLERWDVGRGVDDRGATGLTLSQKKALMRAVGYKFHERRARVLPRREVESEMARVLPSLGQPEERAAELLDWVERRTGLLADGDWVTFAHLAFQEYFAAQAVIGRQDLLDRLLEPARLFDPWWQEVLFLCAGLSDDATDLVRRVYSPAEDDLFRRRLFLAGRCVGEAARVDPALRREVREGLLQMWRTGSSRQHKEALAALAVRPDEETVEHFLAALKYENEWVRWAAAEALGRLGVAEGWVVEGLLAALKDENEWVRWAAARALGRLGVAEGWVVEGLLAALKDENEWVRWAAARALGRLGVAEERVVEGLLAALKNADAGGRRVAARALGLLGAAEGLVVKGLLAALKDADAGVRWAAAEALGDLGVAEGQVVEGLLAALNDESWPVRQVAAGALGRLGVAEERVVDGLLAALKDADAGVRWDAAWTLGHLGVAEGRVVEGLLAALKDEDGWVRGAAALALGRLGVAEERVVDGLLAALKDWPVREAAAEALGRLGVAEERVVDGLLAALKDGREWVRSAAAEALGRLGVAEERVVDGLLAALEDPSPQVTDAAFDALWSISEKAGLWIGPDGQVVALNTPA